MSAANRTVVTITVMMVAVTVVVRICLVDSHSPIGADASRSIDAIDTGGRVARLSEHERAKCNHDGEHRCAISGDAQHSVFHFKYLFGYRRRMVSSLLYNENPGHGDRGFLSLQHFAMQGNASSPLGDKSMRAQYVNTL
jgi:hypothetical protein